MASSKRIHTGSHCHKQWSFPVTPSSFKLSCKTKALVKLAKVTVIMNTVDFLALVSVINVCVHV